MRLDEAGAATPLDELTSSFGVLILEDVQVDDSGTYRCTASNSVGHSQYDVRLRVIEPLRVQVQPSSAVVNEGKSVTLTCSFSGGAAILEAAAAAAAAAAATGLQSQTDVKWYKDGRVMSQRGNSLHIDDMQRADQGVYQCFVYTDKESAQASSRLQLGGMHLECTLRAR